MGQKMLENNIFAFYYGSSPEMNIGFYDKSKFKGDLDWHLVEDKYGYGIRFDDIKVKGESLNICKGQSNCLLTIDSGSSQMAFPKWGVDKMVSKGLPAGGHGAACGSAAELGDLTFVIGGKDYLIPNSDWVTSGSSMAQRRNGLTP